MGRPLKSFTGVADEAVEEALEGIAESAYASSTWRNIRYSTSRWLRYVRDSRLETLPLEDRLLTYIGWSIASGMTASSVLTEHGNICAALKLEGTVPQGPRLALTLKGLHKMKTFARQNRATPIPKDVLLATVDRLRRTAPRAAAILAICWVTCSRVGDVRRTRVSDITVKDSTVEIDWSMRKDWRNVGVVTSAHTGRLHRAIANGLIGLPGDAELGGGLDTADIAKLLPPGYTGHSIRRGAAQHALQHASPEATRTLTLHATMVGLLRYAPKALARSQLEASAALAR